VLVLATVVVVLAAVVVVLSGIVVVVLGAGGLGGRVPHSSTSGSSTVWASSTPDGCRIR
jgi:hypothetical protein